MKYLTIALAKGRLAEKSAQIFEKIGFDCSEMLSKSRKLIFTDEVNKVRFMLVKAGDVPVYVEYGAADLGVVGKDTLLEEERNLYEVLDLGFGKCKMAVAAKNSVSISDISNRNLVRVASKYPNIARKFFQTELGQNVEVIKLSGSVELAPLVGLSEVIVDIVESGKTLEENGLSVIQDICELSAILVANKVSMKLEKERIMDIVKKIGEEV